MKNIKLTIQYDGSNYSGWQSQDNAKNIQDEMEKALKKITKEKINLISSGRTDKGVHAIGQVANFRTSCDLPADKFKYYFPKHLPDDIVVVDSQEVSYFFHARHDAVSKTYTYKIYNGQDLHPVLRNTCAQIPYKFDLDLMKRAASELEGRHDFSPFTADLAKEILTVREVDEIKVSKDGKYYYMSFKAKSFMRHQVRMMAGTIMNVGRGKLRPEDIFEIFIGRCKNAGPSLPGKGLYLQKVEY